MKMSTTKSAPAASASATKSNTAYCPDTDDIVWLDFDPQAGREQAGRRPAFVLSPRKYNQATGLALVCPITSHPKGYPYEVSLPADCKVSGVILADHIKSMSWMARGSEFETRCPEVTEEVVGKLGTLLPL